MLLKHSQHTSFLRSPNTSPVQAADRHTSGSTIIIIANKCSEVNGNIENMYVFKVGELCDFPGFFQSQLRDHRPCQFVDYCTAEDDGTDPGTVIGYDRHGGGSKTDSYTGLGD